MVSREFSSDTKCRLEIRAKNSLTCFIYSVHFFYPWCLFWLSARKEAGWRAGCRSWRGHYQFYWVGLTPEKLKRNYYFISGYTFNASCVQKCFFLLSAWQRNSQNPFRRPLYTLKLVLQAGTLPVIFLLFSWKRIRHIYCPCICNHGKISYLIFSDAYVVTLLFSTGSMSNCLPMLLSLLTFS